MKGGFERHFRPAEKAERSDVRPGQLDGLLQVGRRFRILPPGVGYGMTRPLSRRGFEKLLHMFFVEENGDAVAWVLTPPRPRFLDLADWIREANLDPVVDWFRLDREPAGTKWLPEPFVRGHSILTRGGAWVHVPPGLGLTTRQEEFLLRSLAGENIPADRVGPEYRVLEFDSGDPAFGLADRVETGPRDEVVYAHLGGRHWGRFVMNRDPEPSPWVTAIIRREGDAYRVHRAFVGRKAEPWPCDRNAGPEAWKFWQNRALVWGALPVVKGSERYTCPWYRL